jgi:hypothetical protein
MKLDHNWRQKSIENLEKKNWGEIPSDESSIVIRAMKLRKTPLEVFSIDDIRFMIGQQIGLKYLLVLAIEILNENVMAEGNYYEGDLLNSIFLIKKEHWKDITAQWHQVDLLIKDKINELRHVRPRLKIDDFYSNRPN